jgi:hypothetical protein
VKEDDGLTVARIDIADLGVEHLNPTSRKTVGTVRFRGRDDGFTPCHVGASRANERETPQHKSTEGTACELPSFDGAQPRLFMTARNV